MDFDQMIIQNQRYRVPSTYKAALMVVLPLAILFGLSHWDVQEWPVWAKIAVLSVSIPVWRFLYVAFRRRWLDDVITDRASWMPHRKQEAAWCLYGDRIDADLAVIECEEAHVPGDCPLCGAE